MNTVINTKIIVVMIIIDPTIMYIYIYRKLQWSKYFLQITRYHELYAGKRIRFTCKRSKK